MVKVKFWIFCVLMLVLLFTNYHYTTRRCQAAVTAETADRLEWSENRLAVVRRAEDMALLQAVTVFAGTDSVRDPLLTALNRGLSDLEFFQGIVEALGEEVMRSGAEPHRLFVLADSEGAVIYHVNHPALIVESLPDIAALRSALEGKPRTHYYYRENELLNVAAVPVIADDAVIGALLMGYKLNGASVKKISESLGADLSFVVGGRVVASSLDSAKREGPGKLVPGSSEGGIAGFGSRGGFFTSVSRGFTGLDPMSYYGRVINIDGADGLYAVLSVSVEEHAEFIQQYQVYQFAALFLIIVVGAVWAFFIAESGNVPVRRMANQISRAASGDMMTRLTIDDFTGEFRRLAELMNGALDRAVRRGAVGSHSVIVKRDSDISSLLTEVPTKHEDEIDENFDFGFPFSESSRKKEEISKSNGADPAAERQGQSRGAGRKEVEEDNRPVAVKGDAISGLSSGRRSSLKYDPGLIMDPPMDPPVDPAMDPEPQFVRHTESSSSPGRADPGLSSRDAQTSQPPPSDNQSRPAQPAKPKRKPKTEIRPGFGFKNPTGVHEAVGASPAFAGLESLDPPMPPQGGVPSGRTDKSDVFAEPFGIYEQQEKIEDSGSTENTEEGAATVVAEVPEALIQATARKVPVTKSAPKPAPSAPPDPDHAHFQEVFQTFLKVRRSCGESVSDVTFEKFAVKLRKTREAIMKSHGGHSVKFHVHVKGGKAALKATPVR